MPSDGTKIFCRDMGACGRPDPRARPRFPAESGASQRACTLYQARQHGRLDEGKAARRGVGRALSSFGLVGGFPTRHGLLREVDAHFLEENHGNPGRED
jgi:hypothetical protein